MSRKLKNWDAKKYGAGSNRGVKRISAKDIRLMVKEGIDPKKIVKKYDKNKFGKDTKTGGGTERAVDKLRRSLEAGKKRRGNPSRGGGKGGAGKGGGPIKGPDNKEGLSFFEGTQGMTPAEFELYRETKLRGIDSENANKLQNIINSGKIEVAAIQRDASIYGSLVSGFW